MIFRIDGEVGELLALTPIIREWRLRHNGEKVLVETNNPSIFSGNQDVAKASPSISEIGDFYDMNLIRWRECGAPVAEVYAEKVFGDKNLKSWKVSMFSSADEVESAKYLHPDVKEIVGKKTVAVSFNEDTISGDIAFSITCMLLSEGYTIYDVSYDRMGSWGAVYAAIGMSDLFVGSDGDVSAIALATDRPAIVTYSFRSSVYFPPFRKNIPFVALAPSKQVCEHADGCHARHSHIEFSKLYSLRCIMDRKYCYERELDEEVLKAIRQINDKA